MNIENKISKINYFFSQDPEIFLTTKLSKIDTSIGYWGTTILIDIAPYDMERNGLKRGKKLSQIPNKKDDKFHHILNDKAEVIAILGYISNYNEPNQYLFIERKNDEEYIFSFDISKKLDFIQLSLFSDKRDSLITLQKNGNYVAEEYFYNSEKQLIEINRHHKDIQRFKDTNFFPQNVFKSSFLLKYEANGYMPSIIQWDANQEKEMRIIYPR